MGLEPVRVVEEAKRLTPADLDKMSTRVRAEAPDLRPGLQGEMRAYAELLDLSFREKAVYTLLLKRILDLARQYHNGVMASIGYLMEDHQIAKAVIYNAGGWQALAMLVQSLQPAELEKRLVELREQSAKMGRD